MSLEQRNNQSQIARHKVFDAVIIGGGINGASIYRELSGKGLCVLLIDKGDFAGGTSQASSMMIWGGLIHMRQMRLATVWGLCKSRDDLIRQFDDQIQAQTCRFLQRNEISRNRWLAYAGMASYWLCGMQRRMPRFENDFSEKSLIDESKFKTCIAYEEAMLFPSDARFILNWIVACQTEDQLALNYCSLDGGGFDKGEKMWRLEIADRILSREFTIRCRVVINAAGTWTDDLNRRFQIATPFKHVFGKGVAITFRRDKRHILPLMIETPDYRDCMSLIPWGPVSIWGPTETRTSDLDEGFRANTDDVSYLLRQANDHLASPVTASDIVSIRCGVRPLAVDNSFSDYDDSIELSRRHLIHRDKQFPWISIFGGKITSSVELAKSVGLEVSRYLSAGGRRAFDPVAGNGMRNANSSDLTRENMSRLNSFPGLDDPVPSADWSAKYEMCWDIEDYLRRRTNIAQWVPRRGMGTDGENRTHLLELAKVFRSNEREARDSVEEYEQKVSTEFDQLLAKCTA